jgi:hypothetical protein
MVKKPVCLVVILWLTGVLLSCAHVQVQQRQNEIKALIDPLLGKSRADVVLALGVPTSTKVIGGLEVYQYYRSYGTRSNALIAPDPYLTTAAARSWEAYDIINTYFKDGIMVKWDGYVQR